jgi:hypothetical protein
MITKALPLALMLEPGDIDYGWAFLKMRGPKLQVSMIEIDEQVEQLGAPALTGAI